MNTANGKRLILLVLSVLALISVISGIKNAYHYSQDFQWDAAKALCLGYDPYDLSLGIKDVSEIAELEEFYNYFDLINAKQKMEANQFPSLLLLLFAFTVLNYRQAVVFWIVANIIFTISIILLLRKTYMKELTVFEYSLLSLLMVAGTPWRNQIGVGQHTLFAFAFFLLAIYLSDIDDEGVSGNILSGVALAISYFKYTLTAPLALIFIYRKKWKSLLLTVLTHVVLTFLIAVYLGKTFIDMLIEPLKVSSALATEGSIDISALLSGSKIAYILALVIMFIMFVGVFFIKVDKECIIFTALLLISLIITYHRTYDYFVLTAAYPGVKALGEKTVPVIRKALHIFYYLLLLYFFFGLRVFSESGPSVAVAAVIYYGFVIFYLGLFAKTCLKGINNG